MSNASDFDQQPTAVQSRPGEDGRATAPVFALVVTSGPAKGTRFVIDPTRPGSTLVGKSETCAVRVVDREVSRRHASLECVGGALRITDLATTNGTYVDQVHVLSADLHGGEVVRVGSTTMRVESSAATSLPPIPEATQFGRVLGTSREMRCLYPLCERIALSTVPIVIEGETGTGKEVLAEALHEN